MSSAKGRPTSTKAETPYELALEGMRKVCSAFPEYSEGRHSGAIAFKSGGRMFATLRQTAKGDGEVVLGLEPAHAAALVELDPRFEPYPRAPHTVRFHASHVGKKELEALVRESYALYGAPRASKPARRSRR